jgi:endonuclease IV
MEVHVGPALSCTNQKDRYVNGKVIPDSLADYIHEYRTYLTLPQYIIELQPEPEWVIPVGNHSFGANPDNNWHKIFKDPSGDFERIRRELNNQPGIIGIHAPNMNIDILSPDYDQYIKRKSIASIIESMRFANEIKADYFIFHLTQKDRWVGDENRIELINESLRVFSYFAEAYHKENFSFVPCIEILEFPKFPSVEWEIPFLFEKCKEYLPNVKVAFDIAHLWRSRSLICETRQRKYPNTQCKPFSEVMEETLEAIGNNVYIWHLAGCYQTETHNVPGIHPSQNPLNAFYRLNVPDECFDEFNEMNYSRALDLVVKHSLANNQPVRMILEVFNKEYPVVLKAIDEIRKALLSKSCIFH